MRKLLFFLFPLLFFAAAYVLPLDSRNFLNADETRYAEIAREMLASSNWIVPRLNGVGYFAKPVMGYWIYAAAQKLLGETPLAMHLPPVAATGATAALLFLLVWRACRRSWPRMSKGQQKQMKKKAKDAGETAFLPAEPLTTASVATTIYLSLSGVFGIGSMAVAAPFFTFFLAGTLGFFLFALESQKNTVREYAFLLVAGLFCAGAFLTEGFPALILPIIIITPWLCWQGRIVDIMRMGWLPLLTVFAVTLPWNIQIHWWEKDFWHFFIVNEQLRPFLAEDSPLKEPFWFFLLYSPGLILPWLLLLPAAIRGLFMRNFVEKGVKNAQNRLLSFSLFWMIIPFLFFSCSQAKQLISILPCCLPLAIYLGFGLSHFFTQKKEENYFRWPILLLGILLFLALGLLVYIQIFGLEGLRHLSFTPGGTPLFLQTQKMAIAAGTLICAIVFYLFLKRKKQGIDRAFLFALVFLPLFAGFWFAPPQFIKEQPMPSAFFEQYKEKIGKENTVATEVDILQVKTATE